MAFIICLFGSLEGRTDQQKRQKRQNKKTKRQNRGERNQGKERKKERRGKDKGMPKRWCESGCAKAFLNKAEHRLTYKKRVELPVRY